MGPCPTSSAGWSSAPINVEYGMTTWISGLPGVTGWIGRPGPVARRRRRSASPSAVGAVGAVGVRRRRRRRCRRCRLVGSPASVSVSVSRRRRPLSRAARMSARRASIERGSSEPRPRASRVSQVNAPAASVAVSIAHNVPIPSGSAVTTTRRSRRACWCRCSAPSGSAASTARASAALSWARVCSGARGSTRACTALGQLVGQHHGGVVDRAGLRGVDPPGLPQRIRVGQRRQQPAAPARSGHTRCPGPGAARPRPRRGRTRCPPPPTAPNTAPCRWDGGGPARRAAAPAAPPPTSASRSNPIIASISVSSDSRAGSAVAESRSSASHPDGAHLP